MNRGVVVWFRTVASARHRLFGLMALGAIALALLAYVIAGPEGDQAIVRAPVPEPAAAKAPKLPKLVVTFRDRPPDMLVYSKGRFSGPLRYVLEEAAGRIGHSVEWREATLAESEKGSVVGSVDVIPYIHQKTAEREEKFRFSVSLGSVQTFNNFMQHVGDQRKITTLADFAGMSVGHRAASAYFAEFATAKHFKRIPVEDMRSLVRVFADRSVDTIIVNNKQETERALAGKVRVDKIKYADLVVKIEAALYVLYSRAPERQKVFDRLDQAIVKMRKEGFIEDIYRSFDADPPESR